MYGLYNSFYVLIRLEIEDNVLLLYYNEKSGCEDHYG